VNAIHEQGMMISRTTRTEELIVIPSSKNQLALAGVSDAAAIEASRIAESLAALLSTVPSPQAMTVVGFVLSESIRQTQETATLDPVTIDLARQKFDPQQAAANLREIRETGGHTLAEIDDELEKLAQGRG
jgi:hypothetical protein